MTKFAKTLCTALALVVASGCAGGGHGGNVIPSASGSNNSGTPTSSVAKAVTFEYGAKFLRDAQPTGPAQLDTFSMTVAIKPRDEAGLLQYARTVSDPKSGNYRRFLTPESIADRYGASSADYEEVVKYFQGYGLQVGTWKNREAIHVAGKRAQMETAIGAQIGRFSRLGTTFYAPLGTPHLSKPLAVESALGLITYPFVRSTLRHSQTPGGGSSLFGFGYSPFDLASAFDYTGSYNAGFTGKGIKVGIIGTGPISAADVPAFRRLYNVPGSSTTSELAVQGGSFSATLPPVTAPCTGAAPACNEEDGEAQLDTEQVASLAIDSNVLFYSAFDPTNPGDKGSTLQFVYQEIIQALNDNVADVLSLSFGESEVDAVSSGLVSAGGGGPGPMLFATAVAQGIAVFVASGDSGAEECQKSGPSANADTLCPSYPATDPSVVAVGGTLTPIGTNGRFTGPVTVWGQQSLGPAPSGPSGSGGGVSSAFPAPTYQQGIAGIMAGMRNIPDVSSNADPNTGDAVLRYADPQFASSTSLASIGGTSAAAPDVAAMWALVLGACAASTACATGGGTTPYRLGNPNAGFYAISQNSALYASTFFDVVFGSNAMPNSCVYTQSCPAPVPAGGGGYSAGVGYDAATGLGVPFARSLIKAAVGT